MIGHDDFDRTLADWFEADALSPMPAGSLDRVLDATRRRRPRPAWLAGPGSEWVGEAPDGDPGSVGRSLSNLGLRWSTTLIVLLVVAALVAGAILVGARLFQPSPLPTGRLGHLAYGLNGDIYLADWDGGTQSRSRTALPIPVPAVQMRATATGERGRCGRLTAAISPIDQPRATAVPGPSSSPIR